ncbi:MAG TPA: MarR family winged helix-turn-helix transcriptional regulator [Solirubrobacteraceae bacterium]|nr:MarR family winged helix-turn-helix transcriptional regulator [Solirubrobacteraceae bacterium]
MTAADDPWITAVAVLKLSTRLIDQIDAGVRAAGFADVTPLHGFAFARIAMGDATTADLAAHLGVTKQAAAQLVDRLVRARYVERHPHPADRRARLLELTDRGTACMWAARRAAERAIDQWRAEIPPEDSARFEATLRALTASVPFYRPTV